MSSHLVIRGRLTFADKAAAKQALATLDQQCGADPMLSGEFKLLGTAVEIDFNNFVGMETQPMASLALRTAAKGATGGSVSFRSEGGSETFIDVAKKAAAPRKPAKKKTRSQRK